jgi:hypothetical protein
MRAHARRPGQGAQGPGAGGGGAPTDLRLRLALERRRIQRKAESGAEAGPETEPEAAGQEAAAEPGGGEAEGAEAGGAEAAGAEAAAKSEGQPLDDAVRAEMEQALGADFAAVRVHVDEAADAQARELGARAFTEGADIYFRQGAYQPGSQEGRELLAHELTHVVQQGAAPPKKVEAKVEGEAGGQGEVGAQGEASAGQAEAAAPVEPAAAPAEPAVEGEAGAAPQMKLEAAAAPGDAHEKEADRIAAGVGSPAPTAPQAGAEAEPAELITVAQGFAMAGEGHTLRATYGAGQLDVIMESVPKPFKDKIDEQKKAEKDLIDALPDGDEKSKHQQCYAELDGLDGWFDGEKDRIVKLPDKTQIKPELDKLLTALKTRIVAIGAKYGLKDLVYKSLGVDKLFATIDNLVHKELRKHVGDSGVMGDGHNNTATAAEALDVQTNHGKPIGHLGVKQHKTRTQTCRSLLRSSIDEMDKIERETGLKLSLTPEYQLAKTEFEDCDKALNDPSGYLAGKGYAVVNGDFRKL